MRIMLRANLFCLLLSAFMLNSGKSYGQVDSVTCVSSSTIGASDSTDIGRLIIGKDTIGSVYSHLANSMAEASYVLSADTIQLYLDSTYHFQVATIMKYLHDGPAKLTAFIDYNNDMVYDAATEKIWTAYTTPFVSYIMDTMLTIPGTAIANTPLMMRFIVNNDTTYNAASDSACGTYVSGETMDFVVILNTVTTGIKNANASTVVSVWPSPASNNVHIGIKNSGIINQLSVRVLALNGQEMSIQQASAVSGDFNTTIDVSRFAKGLYMVEVIADGKKQVSKLSVN